MTASTNAYYPPYYDENGVFHMHDNNRLVTEYQCDNLHKWTEARVGRCPNCDFGQNIKEITYG